MSDAARARLRLWLRGAAFLASLGLVGLWIAFARVTFAASPGGVPAPGAFVVTLMFGGVALAGGIAALRDVPVGVAITGLIGLVPVGLYLALFPPTRWITLLDAALLGIGIVLMRTEPVTPPEPPESPDFDRPPST